MAFAICLNKISNIYQLPKLAWLKQKRGIEWYTQVVGRVSCYTNNKEGHTDLVSHSIVCMFGKVGILKQETGKWESGKTGKWGF